MALLSRYLAPAGAPIGAIDVARWVPTLAAARPVSALRDGLRERFGPSHYVLTSTGRAGMTLLLRAMRQLSPDRDEVVLPSYTCYSVAASAAKAGLKVRLVDIDPATLDYDPARLAATDFSRVLAIVATNLYGLPGQLPVLAGFARARGAFLIDDAAQAMGAKVGGLASGTWGDAGLFSFDKGKNVCAIDGGVLTVGADDLAAALDREVAGQPGPPVLTSAVHIAKALAYAVLLRPSLYGLVTRIPQLELGKTVFTTDFPLDGPDPALAALAATMLPRLDTFTAARRANAAAYLERLAVVPGIRTITPVATAEPVYLRLPILCATASVKHRAIAALTSAGIGASGSYPASLADVPEVQALMADRPVSADGGREVARCIVTLPTHPYVTLRDIDRAVEVLAAVSAERFGENH
jgi:perosamine synthetase